jgi:hypothetical protein
MAKFVDHRADRAAGRIADTGGAALCDIADDGQNVADIAADFVPDAAECIAGGADRAGRSAGRGAHNIAGQMRGNIAALARRRGAGVEAREQPVKILVHRPSCVPAGLITGAVVRKPIKAAHNYLLFVGMALRDCRPSKSSGCSQGETVSRRSCLDDAGTNGRGQ